VTNSVLFVALDSGGTLTGAQLIELAWGLEMGSYKLAMHECTCFSNTQMAPQKQKMQNRYRYNDTKRQRELEVP